MHIDKWKKPIEKAIHCMTPTIRCFEKGKPMETVKSSAVDKGRGWGDK